MATQSSPEKNQDIEETEVDQSAIQQTQGGAAAQINDGTVARSEALQQETDHTSQNETEDDIPPPAYGEIYGEISDEKDGLGTSAYVTDDGRVNIRINQFNRRLSQIFTPALRQQVQNVEDSQPPPSPYIPPSLGGDKRVPPPPPLNIVIQVVGSRGDVQPFVALGKVLKETYGHRVRLATHPNFKGFVEENGLEFFSIGGDPSRLMAFMVKNPSLVPGFRSVLRGDVGQRRKDVAEYIQGCWRSCYETGDGMDVYPDDENLSRPSGSSGDGTDLHPNNENGSRPSGSSGGGMNLRPNGENLSKASGSFGDGMNLHPNNENLSRPSGSSPSGNSGDGMNLGPNNENPSKASGRFSGSGAAARSFVADCIIANPPSFAHVHCAEKLGIPLHIMFTMPYSPTQAFPHPLANIQSSNADPQLTNYISYAMIEVLSWQGLGDIINRFRAKCLGLDPISLIWAPGMLHRLKVPHTYCWSSALIPKPKDWGPQISICGFSFLNLASNYTPAADLEAFLNAGPPPVYIGFGSIVLEDPDAMTELILEAARKSGQRVLLSKGWGGVGADRLHVPDDIFMLGNVPHDWLFKHVSCVVHHGGAGTTAAGISAGRPTVVVPFFGDQPFWGAMVARAGAGPDPLPHKRLTADKLADAINFCLRPESLERARELAIKIEAERGSDTAAQSFHQYLDVDRLRCTLAPSRAAVWRIKRTRIRLSTFAAYTLANAKLLDFDDVKLFRPREYHTDEGPWDPISGGAAACYRAFSGMAMGVAEVPSETLKPFNASFGSSRRQSNTSGGSTPLTLAEQSQTSLNVQARQPNPPSSVPANGSSSIPKPDESKSHSSPKEYDDSQSRSSNRNETRSAKNRDMLQQTGVHTSNGLGRFVRAAVQAPMGISVGLTRGFHNFPKLWGDDTVRPQQQVRDFKSGAVAAGKEFGYGWYDGVSGLVTQPWKGAQKEGAAGFVKGIGKGLGGFATKPLAGFSGILGHTMKGVHKEVQKLFGSNVQSYIVASRVAQGYEEWLQSSDAEKQDVIDQWDMIQRWVKEKRDPDEMMQDILGAQRKKDKEDGETRQSRDAPTPDPASSSVLQTSELSSGAADINETIRLLVQKISRGEAGEDADTERAIRQIAAQCQHPRQDVSGHQVDEENLRQAMASSEIEAQRQATATLEYENQLRREMEQSLREERGSGRHSGQGLETWGNDKDDEEVAAGRLLTAQQASSSDPGHLAGTTQIEFESQQQGQQEEKTTQERSEEEIVLEYVKKQSALEAHHRNRNQGHASSMDDLDDEDLQKALKLSMQGH